MEGKKITVNPYFKTMEQLQDLVINLSKALEESEKRRVEPQTSPVYLELLTKYRLVMNELDEENEAHNMAVRKIQELEQKHVKRF